MIATIEEHREEIARLCREHGITRLSLFGSAVKGGWRPGESDIDVLIDLEYGPGVGGRFMRFASSLERLLGVRVDITTERSVSSEEFRDELRRTAVIVFGASQDDCLGLVLCKTRVSENRFASGSSLHSE